MKVSNNCLLNIYQEFNARFNAALAHKINVYLIIFVELCRIHSSKALVS